jgi:hypothetical protein
VETGTWGATDSSLEQISPRIFLTKSDNSSVKPILELDKLSRAEKLQAMEELWVDLTANPNDLVSPAWHEEVLRQRERDVAEGRDQFVSIEEAERLLREQRDESAP